jgi:hypothetical protein
MDMKPDEIVVRYRQAKKKSEQLKILADLNACTVDDIIDVLCEHSDYQRNYFNKAKIALKQQSEEPAKVPYKKPEIIPEPPKQEPVENPEPVKESEKLPLFVKQALVAGYVSLVNGIDTRKEQIKELEAEIAELEKDFDALKKWEDEHT